MKQSYLKYYQSLIQEFCQEIAGQDLQGLEHMPQPFLPLFGKGYASSGLKILIMGQDTKGWGKCSHYVESELKEPTCEMAGIFGEIEGQSFREWGKSTNSFWGFAMAILAEIHGIDDWRTMKWGEHAEVLSSFAWANCNTIELWPSLRKHTSGVPKNTWAAVRRAGERLHPLRHTLETTRPDVIILTCWSNVPTNFYEGLEVKEHPDSDNYLKHLQIEGYGTHILQTCHPGWMRNVGGPWGFLNDIRSRLKDMGLAPEFPKFTQSSDKLGDGVLESLAFAYGRKNVEMDKYRCIEWVAGELYKQQAFMAVPALAELLNRLNFRTDYGTEYVGGRGSYRLVRGAYSRAHGRNAKEQAHQIAISFRKPDFTYPFPM
ncbi:MAG: hypothetical protein ACSHX0_13245 [Akkermansiaceae bacterium]